MAYDDQPGDADELRIPAYVRPRHCHPDAVITKPLDMLDVQAYTLTHLREAFKGQEAEIQSLREELAHQRASEPQCGASCVQLRLDVARLQQQNDVLERRHTLVAGLVDNMRRQFFPEPTSEAGSSSGTTATAVEQATQKELEIELRTIRQAMAHLGSRNYEVFYETSDEADQDEEADEADEDEEADEADEDEEADDSHRGHDEGINEAEGK
ncbi:hypothetical protein BD626DRAFT_573866 [Schizophyllum amplum]|uniref:Uncharacterized protein n=1 Tax=Schizophyllum amplum TaxID=97359 RepID=A0A550BZS5_9AGAR|nr:hypothetical protein BD626DRAFT_573866 [Auriculariopsis ampla]